MELTNKHNDPQHNFMFDFDDVIILLEVNRVYLTEDQWEQLSIWHTHPHGGVGPSRMDMRHKVKGLGHLVVSLTDDGPIASWY